MSKNKKFIIGGIVVVIALAVLVVGYLQTGAYSYYNVSEFIPQEQTLAGKAVSVSGILQPGFAKQGMSWTFTLKDVNTSDTLAVAYTGAVPETFIAGQQVTVEGKFDAATGTFRGTSIIVKCASKYEPVTT